MIENAVSVRPYWTLLCWFCALCSPDILKQPSFYNPSPPSSVGFPEFCLMLDCGSLPTGLLRLLILNFNVCVCLVCVCIHFLCSFSVSFSFFFCFLVCSFCCLFVFFYLSICFLRRWRRYRTYVWGSQGNFGRDGGGKNGQKTLYENNVIFKKDIQLKKKDLCVGRGASILLDLIRLSNTVF